MNAGKILVLDASSGAAMLVGDPISGVVEELLTLAKKGDWKIAVPEHFFLECGNVLWKRARFQGMSQETFEKEIDDLQDLEIEPYPGRPMLKKAASISFGADLSFYDAVYAALAHSMGAPLVTNDAKAVAKLQSLPISCLSPANALEMLKKQAG